MKWLILVSLLGALALLASRMMQAGEVPKVGEAAPDFNLPDQHNQMHTLQEYADKWLVLYFYPKDERLAARRRRVLFVMTCIS